MAKYLRGISRFEYWFIPSINKLLLKELNGKFKTFNPDKTAHRYLSDQYKKEFENGSEEAIFEYAKSDVWAFREKWVVNQIEKWRVKGQYRKLEKLIKAYKGIKGKRLEKNLREIIKRDQNIFKDFLKMRKKEVAYQTVVNQLAEKYLLGEDTIKETVQIYRKKYKYMISRYHWKTFEFFKWLKSMLRNI